MTAVHVALTLLLAALSITLASVEAAFYMLKRRRLSLEAAHDPRAQILSTYLEDPPTLLMPIHMGTFTAHAGMTVLLTAMFFDWLHTWALILAFLAMVLYMLLFRLTVPYALVRHDPEGSLLFLIPLFHLYARALAPLVRALRERAEGDFGQPEEPPPAAPVALHEVPPPPVLDPDGVRLAEAVELFRKTQVRDVMTPRPDVVAIEAAAPLDRLRAVMRESKYSRIPIYRGNLDDIVGVVTVRDLVEHQGAGSDPAETLARPVHLVPETKKIVDLLRELQSQRLTFAVVIDEYGGTAGVVSMEDIVEELVGEIKDEYDVESEPIVIEPDGGVVVAGRVSLDRLEQALETDLADNEVVGTVGGLVTAAFGRIPRAGEQLEHLGFSVEVLDADRKRVNRVRIRRVPVAAQEE